MPQIARILPIAPNYRLDIFFWIRQLITNLHCDTVLYNGTTRYKNIRYIEYQCAIYLLWGRTRHSIYYCRDNIEIAFKTQSNIFIHNGPQTQKSRTIAFVTRILIVIGVSTAYLCRRRADRILICDYTTT